MEQWPKTALLGVRQHAEALKGQMNRNTIMRLRRGCGENKKQHYHHCNPVSSALAAARTATQESAFTATVDAAKIRQVDNGAHQHRLLETTLCLLLLLFGVYNFPSIDSFTLVLNHTCLNLISLRLVTAGLLEMPLGVSASG